MHIYIYDYFLKQKKYDKIVAKIETRLTDLGLNGKNCRVGPLKSLKSIVTDELRNNPNTLVAVGNNGTLNQLINATGESDVTVGFIPIGPSNSIAGVLGIENEDQACNILSARLIETIDLGVINDTYFISNARINCQGTIIEVNGQYTIEPVGQGVVQITNLATSQDTNQEDKEALNKYNPKDGMLEMDIKIKQKGLLSNKTDQSFIQTRRLIINNLKQQHFIIDESIEIKTPVELGVIKEKLSLIVGKNRAF